MSRSRQPVPLRLVLLAVPLALAVAGPGNARAGVAQAPARQASETCSWVEIGAPVIQSIYHHGAAMDTVAHQGYFFGGVDQSADVASRLARLDLSPASLLAAVGPVVTGTPGVQGRYGAVCYYRPAGKPADSAIYCVGGAADATDGDATASLQKLAIATGVWTANENPLGLFNPRLYHAGAFSPAQDLGVFHGGTRDCPATASDDIPTCTPDPLGTSFLKYDPTTGAATWSALVGTDPVGRNFLHAMVYDPTGSRMVLFGGSSDGVRARGDVYTLDLSAANPPTDAWTPLATVAEGRSAGPALMGHAAALHKAKRWMIVYGGTTRGFQTAAETASAYTYALDLSATPPIWFDLGTDVGPLVGATMLYDELHRTVILHGGRTRFRSTGASTNRKTYALECGAPTPDPTAPTPIPGRTPSATPPQPGFEVCDGLSKKVPAVVINTAMANPAKVAGYGLLCNPNQPESVWNVPRRFLSLQSTTVPFHPTFNGLAWKCGCY